MKQKISQSSGERRIRGEKERGRERERRGEKTGTTAVGIIFIQKPLLLHNAINFHGTEYGVLCSN